MEKIRLAVALRNEWLAVGLSTDSADRPAAEAAVCQLYEMAGASPPAFEWTPSPLAGLQAVRAVRSRYPVIDTRRLLTDQPWRDMPVAARLASLETRLRSRLDARIRRAAVAWPALWGASTGTEDTRELTVEVADAGNGQTAIRVDAQVTWLPAREASEMVPAAATAITLSMIPDPNLNGKPPRPATVTSPEAVRRVTAAVTSLPVFPPGQRRKVTRARSLNGNRIS